MENLDYVYTDRLTFRLSFFYYSFFFIMIETEGRILHVAKENRIKSKLTKFDLIFFELLRGSFNNYFT